METPSVNDAAPEVPKGVDVMARSTDINAMRRQIGMVFQSFNLYPHMTALRNVTLALAKVLGKPRAEAERIGMAALDRVGRELSVSYPSLAANIYMTILELRAGRTLSEALENLGDRLGLKEARSFATLLQQSEELGASLTDALRVYSDDMRHQRLSRAEEKAYSLPAKLSVPLTLCVFPVVVLVIMLPVYVRFKYAQ